MSKGIHGLVLVGLGAALGLALFLSPFASDAPDGLERVAGDQGFDARCQGRPVWGLAPLGDYTFPGLSGRWSPA